MNNDNSKSFTCFTRVFTWTNKYIEETSNSLEEILTKAPHYQHLSYNLSPL